MVATLIADDLTGACDAGALFSGAGPIGIVTDGLAVDPHRDVVAADTETRALDAGEAAKEVWSMARRLAPRFALGPAVKKLDSTLRGQVAAELDAMLLATGLRAAVVCPTFPAQGRTVVDGILRVDGIPAHESPIGRDPFYPGPTSLVIDIVKDGTERTVAHLRLRDLRWSHERLCRALDEAAGELIVADAETDADLDALARAALVVKPPLLLAGSAGLAGALARALKYPPPPRAMPRTRRWLIVAGSVHPATRAQIRALADADISGCRVDGAREPDTGSVLKALSQGRPAYIATNPPGDGVDVRRGREMAAALAAVAADMVARAEPDVVAATGGDTAWALLEALGATRLEITGAPLSGLAIGTLVTRDGSTLSLLTKAGGFGAPDLFLSLLKGTV
jgi:uncharacterized protein YgbK (DUF1537 family)